MTRQEHRAAVTLIAIILYGLAVGPGMSHGSADPTPAREALRASFASDIRNLVYRWDSRDPRPEDERRRALFEFIYQTYESSAWIPQSLFDKNLITQVIAGDVETIVRDKAGLTPWRDNAIVPAFGMAPNAGEDDLKWTVNCLTCHTAEIDGITYFGAGTKTFDDKWLGESLRSLTAPEWRGLLARNRAEVSLAAEAHRILSSHHHDKIDSLTRGRSTAFAASHVELYMRPHNGAMPAVDEVGRGDVKTPPLWHTAAKIPSGQWYSDGSFHGAIPLMASSMELEKDRSFDALVSVVIPRIRQEFSDVVRHLRPPPYPYEIDRKLAERGKALFYSESIGCSQLALTVPHAATKADAPPARVPGWIARMLQYGFLYTVTAIRADLEHPGQSRTQLRMLRLQLLAHFHGLAPGLERVNVKALRHRQTDINDPDIRPVVFHYLRSALETLGAHHRPIVDELSIAVSYLNAACALAVMNAHAAGTIVDRMIFSEALMEASDVSHARNALLDWILNRFSAGTEALWKLAAS